MKIYLNQGGIKRKVIVQYGMHGYPHKYGVLTDAEKQLAVHPFYPDILEFRPEPDSKSEVSFMSWVVFWNENGTKLLWDPAEVHPIYDTRQLQPQLHIVKHSSGVQDGVYRLKATAFYSNDLRLKEGTLGVFSGYSVVPAEREGKIAPALQGKIRVEIDGIGRYFHFSSETWQYTHAVDPFANTITSPALINELFKYASTLP